MRRGSEKRKLANLWRLVIASLLAVSAGYLFCLPIEIPMKAGLLSSACTTGFHRAEGPSRWTRGRATVTVPDPGPGLDVEIELLVSGFRPRGGTPPLVVVEAGADQLRTRPGRRESLKLKTSTRGWWGSDLELRIRSETFTPGDHDRRALGVRVFRVRVEPKGALLQWHRAPLRQLIYVSLALALLYGFMLHRGVSARHALWLGYSLSLVWALGYGVARPYAAIASLPFLGIIGLVFVLNVVSSASISVLSETLREWIGAFAGGFRSIRAWPIFGTVLLGAIGVTATYWARPELDIELGSGRETTLVENFGSFDQENNVKFRLARRRARLDLRDFGGGADWIVSVTASLEARTEHLVLVRAGEREIEADLIPEWTTREMGVKAPVGWHSGALLEFPAASESLGLRIHRVQVDRGRSLPSLRILLFVIGSALFIQIGLASAGLRGRTIWLIAGLVLALELVALLKDPVLALPFAPTFFVTTVLSALIMGGTSGLLTVLARRNITPGPVPIAVAAAGLGFVAWLSCTIFPLYQGGHFVFHSSIAEEIWQGEFLTYYLPYPGSMLSRQAQWGNLVIPHPCTYHTIVSPLSVFTREWFYAFEKTVLAGMLAAIAVMASLVATRVAGDRAGAYTGLIAAVLLPTFQLLELGHLMTLFGVFAATLALGFVTLRFETLTEKAIWRWAVGLLTLCFVSYTASLLLTMVTIVLALLFLWRREPRSARSLAWATALASLAAFLLYYVNWTLPFLRESVPTLLAGVGSSASESGLLSRAAAWPGKLAYTYGNAFVPILGLAGLVLARPLNQRILLMSWGAVLLLFSVADLFFNFLLKHHYFVIPVVAIGCGLLADRMAAKAKWGRLLAAAFVLYVVYLGGQYAIRVALG